MKIPKQEYTAEFKELAVQRVKSGQAVSAVAKELGLSEQTLRNWVKAGDAGKLNRANSKAVTPEQMKSVNGVRHDYIQFAMIKARPFKFPCN